MRKILVGLVALGSIGFAAAMPASADVYVQTPGVTGAPAAPEVPYWRQHEEWRAQREFRDEQYRHQAWMANHCVRDWNGQAYCRP
jgi:hypothetical protein